MSQRKKRKRRGIILTVVGAICLVIGAGSMMLQARLDAEIQHNAEMQLRMMMEGNQQEVAGMLSLLTGVGYGGLVLGAVLLIVGLVLLFTLPSFETNTVDNQSS